MHDLEEIRIFLLVAKQRSFTAAATEANITLSAVSKRISRLEQRLGVQLLNRTTRSASPTENGRLYYERCLAILADIEEAETAVSHLQETPRGVLRVNAPMSFGTMHLGRVIGTFMERYPDLEVRLILSDQQIDTVQEGFDLTIRIASMADSSLVARKIAPAPRVLCASPAYLKRRGTPKHPDDLRQHDCLSYDYLGTGVQWKLKGNDGEHWLHVPTKLSTNNAEVLRDAALSGRGIALLPTFIAGSELLSGKLRVVLSGYHAPELSVCALFPPTRHLSTKVRVFIDFLVEQFGKDPGW